MVVDDVQFLNILKGKRIKLTLKSSSYLGVVQRINPNKTLILADVVSGSNGCKFPGSKMFFGHEILNVEFTSEANTGSGNIHDHRLEEHLNVEKFQPYRKTIALDDDEDEEDYIDFVVIDAFHEKFGSAVMHIKKQHVIGVGADGVEVFKNGRLCWLQIATKNKVYLFDILLLGARAFKNGLSMILENKHILKVIHDCRAIAGCLIAQFGVGLTNVFDTQVADLMCFYSETGGLLPDRISTLQEVVSLHLKVPSSQLLSLQVKSQLTKEEREIPDRISTLQEVVSLHLKVPSSQLLSLQVKSQLTKEEREMWFTRPCPVPLLKVMALSVIHLQPLRLVLLDTLMTDYMALVDSYLNSRHYEPDELEHVSMEGVLELPKELRQLEQMRRERQEWATNHYPVTEEGLLARFNPRTRSPSQTKPAAEERGQTQADSFEPATVESPSQVDPLLHEPPTSPPRVDDVVTVDVQASPDPAAQAPVPASASDLKKQMSANSPLSGVGRGRTEVLMDTMGRGRPFGKEQSSIPTLPAIGRGFLLQMTQDQIPRENPNHTLAQEVMPQPGPGANDPPKDTFGTTGEHFSSTPESISSSLMQSFRSFRR